MTWQPNLSYGLQGDKFGQRDYVGNLREVWEADKNPSAERQRKLMQRRRDMLSWIKANEDKVDMDNRPDISGGLHDRITQGKLAWDWTGTQHEDAEVSERGREHFGRSDELAARAAGHSWTDILGFLDENPDRLGEKNVKGAGGLYDEIAGHAKLEKVNTDITSALGGLTEGWQDQTDQLSGAFEKGMGGVSDAIRLQTQAEEKYRADQADWQRRQENMQQMMIQEGRRKAKEKPVMAVMPGASSYGGGAGGASAFARKKKQTTGLNIA